MVRTCGASNDPHDGVASHHKHDVGDGVRYDRTNAGCKASPFRINSRNQIISRRSDHGSDTKGNRKPSPPESPGHSPCDQIDGGARDGAPEEEQDRETRCRRNRELPVPPTDPLAAGDHRHHEQPRDCSTEQCADNAARNWPREVDDADHHDRIRTGHPDYLRRGHAFFLAERPKLSDPARGARGLQPERAGRVRCSAWLGVASLGFTSWRSSGRQRG